MLFIDRAIQGLGEYINKHKERLQHSVTVITIGQQKSKI